MNLPFVAGEVYVPGGGGPESGRIKYSKNAFRPVPVLGCCGLGKLAEKRKFPKVVRRGCKRSFGPREQVLEASCTGAKWGCTGAKEGLGGAKDSWETFAPWAQKESKRPFAPSPNHFWRLSLFGQFPRSTASQYRYQNLFFQFLSLNPKNGSLSGCRGRNRKVAFDTVRRSETNHMACREQHSWSHQFAKQELLQFQCYAPSLSAPSHRTFAIFRENLSQTSMRNEFPQRGRIFC